MSLQILSNPKKSFFLSLIACLVIWLAVGWFFATIYKKKNFSDSLTADVVRLTGQKEEIKNLSGEIESLQPNIHDLDGFLVGKNQEGIVGFIEQVELLATSSDTGIKISSVGVSELDIEEISSDYEFLNLVLEGSADRESLHRFLNLLESLPYNKTINEVNLNVSSSREVESQWQGTYSLSVIKIK